MRIRLTATIDKNPENGCEAGKEFEAVLIHPRSTTVEFTSDANKQVRAFHYEYEVVESVE
ncbi:hypothetical protein [Thalassotalea sp. PLHSN55]|uniref:hypothetical protein n=1 Tax=Thalassotalea sp. PLHSN55 TaxID=3435888 RepID=UPI003F830856